MNDKYINFNWKSVGFNFGNWEEELLWSLNLSVKEIDINKLLWHLDIPYWENDTRQRWAVSPRDVIIKESDTMIEQKRVDDVDIKYPIDLFENEGKLFVLDGLHRLAKLYKQGQKSIRVRIVPKEKFHEIASAYPFELPN